MYGGDPYDYMRAGGESRTRARVTLPVFQNAGTTSAQTSNKELNDTFSGQTVPYNLYKQLEQDVTTTSELGLAIIAKYKQALKNKRNLGRSIDSNNLSQKDDEIIKNFLNLQKRNYATAAYYMKTTNLGDNNNGFVVASKKISSTPNNPVKGGISNKDLNEVWDNLKIAPTDKNTVASEQLSFIAFNDAISNVDRKNNPGLAEMIQLRGYKSAAAGPTNEQGNVSGSTISIADGIATNNTTNEFAALTLPKETPPATTTTPETETEEEDDEVVAPPTYYPKPRPTPFLQDVMALGRAGQNYLSITEDQPWNAYSAMTPYPIQLGRYSPEREINALASTARTMGQAAAFGEAPSRAANLAKFQADSARGIADTLGRYNNLNVTAENQEELAKAQQMNEFQKLRGAGAQDIYDKTAIAKQQATAARQKALDNITKAGINMVTNQAKAQVLNELYPNFNIFPEAGGMMAFVPGAKGFGSDDGSDAFDWNSAVDKGMSLFPNDADAAIRYADGLHKSKRPYNTSSGRTGARNDIFSLFGNQD